MLGSGEFVYKQQHMGVIHVNPSESKSDHSIPALTPSSPSSKFTKSSLLGIDDTNIPFLGVALSFWDNILGPRVRHVWHPSQRQTLQSDLLSHITSQVLSCEICRDPFKCDVDYKFYNLPHKGVIVPAFVFTAKGTHGIAVHSLFLVLPISELKFYLDIHETLTCCFQRLTGKFRVILDKNDFDVSIDVFTRYLSECVKFLSLVHNSSLANIISISDTAFCPEHVLERDFLTRCVASHLMTFGRTLVIGETAERINLVLYTLSMFNSQPERTCSLPFCVKDPQPYHHDFFLQGLIKEDGKSFLPMTEILASRYPTTIIDLTTRDVKQTHTYSDHILHRYETVKNELICLQYGHFEELVVLDQELHASSAYPDTLVQTFMKEIFELPESCWIREAYITQFMRMLHKRAQCLIECAKAESNDGTVPLKIQTIKKIRTDLQLHAEGDFRIVLATAEKLKPGIFCFLKSQRKAERDFTKNVEVL
ncbi:guanine nucleotide exchange factor C9orf72-like [Ruditapes philippinarum]|uniref:guanine nucleotide exchange factor C9orf72-like n=1 Tax=Ruditapes philippinarum TaxID=129788 RepID=UPI00295AF3E0|nr:guanine nucleotide exchange factor C9orf72-like [Ruditapes philippinarum]